MSQLKINISDIKLVAKNLAKELKIMEFKISHSSTLNLVSRSLGFKDYNTYKALNEDNNSIKMESSLEDLAYLEQNFDKKGLEEFPSLDDKFVKLKSINSYDIFIHKDVDDVYYLIFRPDNSYTRRVYYCPHYDTFELDIYQDHMVTIYLDMIEKKHLHSLFFNKLLDIKRTKNYHKKIIGDLMELMDKIFSDREKLRQITNKYSNSELQILWQSKNNFI